MWSLYRKKEDESSGGIFDYSSDSGEALEPLKFSNGKTQKDIVCEILEAINDGHKIIFIKGKCGTGKSAIALNLARHFPNTSIVVPIKSLQEQYENDYTKKHFILKKDGKKLKIAVIKGRNNFRCPFASGRADNPKLPCTIELREGNMEKIKKYIEMNKMVSKFDFSSISDVNRMSIAPVCPHWSPVLPAEISSRALEKAMKKQYNAICGKEFALFHRKRGCGYCDQYENYVNADVLIFNSMKYFLETAMGRKPKTDLDIIDECDEFLDSFANEKRINLNRLVMALSNFFPDTREKQEAVKQLIHLTNEIINNSDIENIIKLKDTKVLDLIKEIIDNPYLTENEDNNYYDNVLESAKSFEHLLEETYISFNKMSNGRETLFGKTEETVFVNLVSINLAQKFQDIVDKNNVLVLMSGTLHSEQVLKDIFSIKEFKIIEAEAQMPGTITKFRTGLEKDCKYQNLKNNYVTRADYLKALSTCVANAKLPALVHVNAFEDLPTELEKAEFQIDNLISREKLKEIQEKDRNMREVDKFKSGEINLLFTTKCSRGADFPGEKCNSVILTKYPYPNIQNLFWKILKKEQPEKFWEFYYDKAQRELIQKIARAVRFKGDHVLLLSPDIRVLNSDLK